MMYEKIFIAVFCVFLSAGPAQGEIFKWTDENGKIHFTDDIGMVPEKEMDRSEALTPDRGPKGMAREEDRRNLADRDARRYGNKKQSECLKRCAGKKFAGRICKQRCGVK